MLSCNHNLSYSQSARTCNETIFSAAEFGGRLVNKAELARLEDILSSFPTTEAEDAKLLEGMHF